MNFNAPATINKSNALQWISRGLQMLEQTNDPEEVVRIERTLESIEHFMLQSGLFTPQQIREANEAKIKARWKLGQLLAKAERGKRGPKGKGVISHDAKQFKKLLKEIGLKKDTADRAQKIAALPKDELGKILDKYKDTNEFVKFDDLLDKARPYWAEVNRERKHKIIKEAAAAAMMDPLLGPYVVAYLDPPWKHDVYSKKGMGNTADRHYPTLTYEEIENFRIMGKRVSEIMHKNAVMFMWCTSSNQPKAEKVLEAYGFEFKASAVWKKDKIGMGHVFRNQHEVLLYGTRGNIGGPKFKPASVFEYPRKEHSAKPPEIRAIIEKMYPGYDKNTRIEIFARGKSPDGWTFYGNQAFLK
jgi:N6-adenosine-specific RNA methylase IME4